MADLLFDIEKRQSETTLIFHGELKLLHSEKIKSILMESSSRQGNERLVLKDVSVIDASAIQLIYLWKKLLTEQGRILKIEWPGAEDIAAVLKNAGITKML